MRKLNWYRACAGAIALAATCCFTLPNTKAAVVFSDDFDRDDSIVGPPGGLLSAPMSTNWTAGIAILPGVPLAPSGTAGIQSDELVINHGNTPSYFQVGYNTSNFASPWNSILTNNPGKITWTFNMQSSLADSIPLFGGVTSTYTSVVLASSSANPAESVGYAVAWGNPNTNRFDQLRLTAFAPENGTPKSSSFIFSGANDNGDPFDNINTEHLSIRVEYDPIEDRWTLFARNDGSDFANPATGSGYIEIGSAIHTDHVGVEMSQVGFAGIYIGTNSYAYDNFTISVVPEPSAFLLGSVGLIGIAAARRRFAKKVA